MQPPPPRRRIDLHRLPRWLQYVIALTVTGLVTALAWHVGKDRPTPHWITAYLVPALGWIGLVLLVTGGIARLLERRRRQGGRGAPGKGR